MGSDFSGPANLLTYADILMSQVGDFPFNESTKKLLKQVKGVLSKELGTNGSLQASHVENQKELQAGADAITTCSNTLEKIINGPVAKKKKIAIDAEKAVDTCGAEESA